MPFFSKRGFSWCVKSLEYRFIGNFLWLQFGGSSTNLIRLSIGPVTAVPFRYVMGVIRWDVMDSMMLVGIDIAYITAIYIP